MKDRLWEYVRNNPGCNTAQIVASVPVRSTGQIESFVQELAEEGKEIRKLPNPEHTGGRRGLVWYAIEEGDEDDRP